ncbi:MAG: outer membrane lipoprotein carrier protein LolA [Bdellovibrionales bacterium]|nr:outer membrane lipoprotein carrier protein LolA [Bdellovibrionales bacterium]
MTQRKLGVLLFILLNIFSSSAYSLDIWKKYSKLKTLTADFSQTKELKSIGVKLKSKGSMNFNRPDYFEWQVNEPKNFVFIFKKDIITLLEDGKVLRTADSANFDKKMLDAISHLKAWLMIDQKFIGEHYEINKLSNDRYEFAPKGQTKMFKNITIDLGTTYPIKKIILQEFSGDTIEIEFSKTKLTYED